MRMVSGVVWKVRVVSFSGSRKRERVPEKGASLVNRQRRVFPSQSMKASLFNVPSGCFPEGGGKAGLQIQLPADERFDLIGEKGQVAGRLIGVDPAVGIGSAGEVEVSKSGRLFPVPFADQLPDFA